MAIDISTIDGAAGLVIEHEVTQDKERTRMRTGRDLLDLQRFMCSQASAERQKSTIKGLFRGRASSIHYKACLNG